MLQLCGCVTCSNHLALFGLVRPVTLDELECSYRDFVKVWHPDRFEGQPVLRQKAEHHFKLVQVAFRELKDHIAAPSVPQKDSDHARASPRSGSLTDMLRACGFPSLIDGKRFFSSSPSTPAHVRLVMAEYESDNLLLFVDLSLLKSAGAYLVLTDRRIICKELLGRVQLDYEEFSKCRLSLDRNKSVKADFFDRLAAKLSGDTQELHISIVPPQQSSITIGPPLLDSKTLALHHCLAELHARLKS